MDVQTDGQTERKTDREKDTTDRDTTDKEIKKYIKKINNHIYIAPFSERTQSAVTSLLVVNHQNHVASYRHAIRKAQKSYQHLDCNILFLTQQLPNTPG